MMQDYNKLVKALRMEREDIENSLKVLSHIVDDDFIITVDEARKIIGIDGETIKVLQAEVERLQAKLNSRTIYGYPVDELIMFAEMCKRNDVQEHDLKQAAWNLELAVRAVAFKEMRDGAKLEVQE